ncbi:MAG: methylated-DNA--[protein]-cysteine S-methyltransferase [Candidatus Caenarcaniphilales bacterium]|nr:methylated-DNA--[protein]-cysteine S-methyltransferase [Candidatus Caenarcaniphilales bacterium]
MQSPLGEILLTSNGEAVTGLYTNEHKDYSKVQTGEESTLPFQSVIKQLNEYFDGKRQVFDLPLAAEGSEFQKRVWKALLEIPFGESKTYGQIAKQLGDSNASRAVGLANGKNPISIIVPCHRVVGASGELTGYAGGLKAKEWLLKHEAKFSNKESTLQLQMNDLLLNL